ncbi:hypothetical protein OO009_05760 [Flavobacteriaceae bacterium KMM 6897]|nr:hypothetical protein [Flavobacteriaceae bacterium KMM 6897]
MLSEFYNQSILYTFKEIILIRYLIKELKENYQHIFEEALLKDITQIVAYKENMEGFKFMEIGTDIKPRPPFDLRVDKIVWENENGDELLLYFLKQGIPLL